MENLLLKKLQLKPGFKVSVLNAPAHFFEIIGPKPGDLTFLFPAHETYDALLLFATTRAEMMEAIRTEINHLQAGAVFWILYPKAKTKLAGDLNLMQSWDDLKAFNLNPCASAAIDNCWTALRIKTIDSTKKSGLGNAEIQQNDYGNYIDVSNKTVNLPPDLKNELEKNSQALNFYEQLSYTNRKEYVLWVLTAKQEKTRTDRIRKSVDKLLAGKKNPGEK